VPNSPAEPLLARSNPYAELAARLREAATFTSIRSLLAWDQETMMPSRAAEFRAEEMALISALEHERLTAPRTGELLAACEADPSLGADEAAAANLREARRDYDRATRIPTDLVAEMARTTSQAVEAWKEARRTSDFPAFRPWLERIVELSVRRARCLGAPPGGELYDALLDDYEPGVTAARIDGTFGPLREALAPLIAEIAGSPLRPGEPVRRVRVPIDRQVEFNRRVAERIGFDFSSGRLDVSTHPFTEGLAPGDTRITTRYAEDRFTEAVGSTIHETGHALYEQGLPKGALHGQPLAQAAGLGMHESQSRLWENHVGRSRAFWEWALPEATGLFGAAIDGIGVDDVHAAVNRVQPSLIRVEADEATYSLHVMLRFDLERAMVRGDLAVADVPAAWNDRIRADLGLEVPDDRHGCLQDIHWSSAAIGYFPTYTLGTLYAAQIWEAIVDALPDVEGRMARGDFAPVLHWLRENVHAHGRRYRAADLCARITGRPLGHDALFRHLNAKLRPLYRL